MTAPTTTARPPAQPVTTGALTGPMASVPGTLRRARIEQVMLAAFIGVPLFAVVAAVPVMWGWGLGWHDVVIAFVMYAVSGHGVTVGFHRYFTHGSCRAKRWVRVMLAVAGSLAIEGPVIRWVAEHRPPPTLARRQGARGRA